LVLYFSWAIVGCFGENDWHLIGIVEYDTMVKNGIRGDVKTVWKVYLLHNDMILDIRVA